MRAGTFTQIYIHIIFAVKERKSLISPKWEEELYKYITGIVQNKKQKLLAINGMPDHIHILIGMKPYCRLSDLISEIKKSSNAFIARKQFSKLGFEWQAGYAAFSHSHSALNNIVQYINNQKAHHEMKSFKQEYKDFLIKFMIDHKDEFLFEWIEDLSEED